MSAANCRYFFLSLGILLLVQYTLAAASIRGEIAIDSSWWPEIYLSAIHSFEELTATSDDFIINSSPISEDGSFIFSHLNLPSVDQIYRLHIRKKGDPVSTIIIGGKEQNHLHFILNDTANVNIFYESGYALFNGLQVKDYWPNERLRQFLQLKKVHKMRNSRGLRERQYTEEEFQESMRLFADSSQHALVALFAIHEIDINNYFPRYKTWLLDWLGQHAADTSSYYNELKRECEFLQFKAAKDSVQETKTPSWLLPFALFAGLLLLFLFFIRKRPTKPKNETALKKLSIRERKVFQLLLDAKSNKEIAAELHIELSTVKSHINSIYSKLNIKSRKEIIKFKRNS